VSACSGPSGEVRSISHQAFDVYHVGIIVGSRELQCARRCPPLQLCWVVPMTHVTVTVTVTGIP